MLLLRRPFVLVILAAVFLSLAGPCHKARGGLPFGIPFFSKKPPGYYESRASEPVSTRQRYYKGKYWPPYPRPQGPYLPWIHRFHAEHYWPYPYNYQDRFVVRDVLRKQIANGWVAATTLYDYYFDPDTQQLTRSGRLRLKWILQNAPESHRIIFVQAVDEKEANELRLASVKEQARALLGDATLPPVMLRVTSPLGRPAEEVRNIRDAELQSQPKPRITPPVQSSSEESEEQL